MRLNFHILFGGAVSRKNTLHSRSASHISLIYGGVVKSERIRRLLLLLGWRLPILGLTAFFVEEGEVVRILTLLTTLAFFHFIINWDTGILSDGFSTVGSAGLTWQRGASILVLASWGSVEVATALVADAMFGPKLIISKRSSCVWRHHITTTVSAPVFMRNTAVLLISKSSGR